MRDVNLPNNIRKARKHSGLTMKQLGALIGSAESSISQYETGKRQPDNETLLRMAEALDTSVGYLLGAENEKAHTSIGERQISDDDIMFALWGDAEDIDSSDLEDVKRYAAFIRERKKRKND